MCEENPNINSCTFFVFSAWTTFVLPSKLPQNYYKEDAGVMKKTSKLPNITIHSNILTLLSNSKVITDKFKMRANKSTAKHIESKSKKTHRHRQKVISEAPKTAIQGIIHDHPDDHHHMPPFVDQLPSGPFFDFERSGNVTALVGQPAKLNCRVNQIGNKTVRWSY